MELLRQKSARIVNSINQRFKRYLFNEIDWKSRLIIIKGSRGVGKTTLILQYLKENFVKFEFIGLKSFLCKY